MLRNLFSSLFDFNSRKDLEDEHVEEKVVAAPVKKNSVSTPTISKYDADIESLKTTYGELKPGMAIEITLQDLLTICPRNRRRIEPYNCVANRIQDYFRKITKDNDVCFRLSHTSSICFNDKGKYWVKHYCTFE